MAAGRTTTALLLALTMAASGAVIARAQGVSLPPGASPWVKGYNSTARLLAGTTAAPPGRSVLAGIDIRMNDGWKTYWRQPGDAGGLAPVFDWSASTNLKSARVLYPMPERIKDPTGQTIGYKKAVVFPVEIVPADATKPVVLRLALEYGICREICVPAEARLELTVPPELASMPTDLAAALSRVPRRVDQPRPGDPRIERASAVLTGPTPALTFEISGAPTEVLVEATAGSYLPMTRRVGETGGVVRWVVDLKGVEDLADLKGKPLTLTIAGKSGAIETTWTVQ